MLTLLSEAESKTDTGAMASLDQTLRSRRPSACVEVSCTEPGRSQHHRRRMVTLVDRRRRHAVRPVRTMVGSRTGAYYR